MIEDVSRRRFFFLGAAAGITTMMPWPFEKAGEIWTPVVWPVKSAGWHAVNFARGWRLGLAGVREERGGR